MGSKKSIFIKKASLLKEADRLVDARIIEKNREETEQNNNQLRMLQQFLSLQQHHDIALMPQNSDQTVFWPNYPNSTTAPRPINMF